MAPTVRAQPLHPLQLESLTINQGLSQGFVTGIVQDKKGFIWFATGDGLNKYDGYTFTVYHHDPNVTTSIGSDDLTCVYEDSQERLWVGTRHNGFDLFDREKGLFTHIRHGGAGSLRSDDVIYITGEKGGVLWIRTNQGIDRMEIVTEEPARLNAANRFLYSAKGFVFTPIILDSAFEAAKDNYAAPDVFVDSRNRILVTTTSKIWELKFSSKMGAYSLTERYHFPMKNPTFTASILEDTTNDYLFLKLEEIIGFPGGDFDSPQRIFSGANMQTPWTIDKNQRLWLPGAGIMTRIGLQSVRVENLALEGTDVIRALNYTTVFYTDRSGVVWMGTGGYGLLKYDSEKEYFHHILAGSYFYQLLKSREGNLVTNRFQNLTIGKNQPVTINPLLNPDVKKKSRREPYSLLL